MAQKFASIAVGDQLMQHGERTPLVFYYVVTDRWFDPVRGWEKRSKGEMVALMRLNDRGEPSGRKIGHTLRGLATQSYDPADIDYIALAKARAAARAEGQVVGIGYGREIRRRPKLAGL